MAKKFIPNGDVDFATMAGSFARVVARDAARFGIGADDAAELSAAVARYAAALQACRHGPTARSPVATREKEDARIDAERIIRRLGHVVRSSERIDAASKVLLGIQPRKERPKVLTCPQEPPRLKFVRALHEGNGAVPVHELSFSAINFSAAKPAGAVRLELFVDLVPPEGEIPAHPLANVGSRPWYLRSYTRSPIRLTPPMPSVPMRIVYWGRWADAAGNVGPFSATAIGWIEGGSHAMLPGGVGMAMPGGKPVTRVIDVTTPAPMLRPRDERYIVTMLEAQLRMIERQGSEAAAELPAPSEQRRIEGPAVEDEREAAKAA